MVAVELSRVTGADERRDEPAEDDEAVVEALEADDTRRALMLCARLHGEALGRFCMAMTGSQADADDLVQETLVEAHKALATWRKEGSLRAFLMTIARRRCARLLEKRARRGAKLRLVHDSERAAAAETEREVMWRRRARRARKALDDLRPTEREALLLRFATGLSYREVGVACGIAEAAARKRVSRAIAHLRQVLEEEAK